MFKSLTARAIIPVTIAVTGFVVVCSILLYQVIKTDMTNEAIKYATNQAHTIVKSTRFAMLHDDRESLANIIDNIGTQEGVEHVRIFNKKGLIMFSERKNEVGSFVDKDTAGCIECHRDPTPSTTLGNMKQARRFTNGEGKEIIAITVPINNEVDCYQAACHVHKEDQKILGTLDIGLSAAPLLTNLTVMQGRLILFSVMVLLVTLGGVAALLRRYVFLPLKTLADFTERTAKGQLDQEFPACGKELETIAAHIRDMARESKLARREREMTGKGE